MTKENSAAEVAFLAADNLKAAGLRMGFSCVPAGYRKAFTPR